MPWREAAFPSRPSPLDFLRDYRRSPSVSRRFAARSKREQHEIDVVITRAHVFGGRWQALYDEVATFKQACGKKHMKVILGTGDLLTFRNVARASFVAMMAGADFIKTSTGKETDERDTPGEPGDGSRNPRIRTANRNGGWLQACRRNSHGETVHRLARDDERRARPVVDARGAVPLWRKRSAGRHRATTGALRDRTILRRVSSSDRIAATA